MSVIVMDINIKQYFNRSFQSFDQPTYQQNNHPDIYNIGHEKSILFSGNGKIDWADTSRFLNHHPISKQLRYMVFLINVN